MTIAYLVDTDWAIHHLNGHQRIIQRLQDLQGSVSKVEMATPIDLIYKVLLPSISTFETPPSMS